MKKRLDVLGASKRISKHVRQTYLSYSSFNFVLGYVRSYSNFVGADDSPEQEKYFLPDEARRYELFPEILELQKMTVLKFGYMWQFLDDEQKAFEKYDDEPSTSGVLICAIKQYPGKCCLRCIRRTYQQLTCEISL